MAFGVVNRTLAQVVRDAITLGGWWLNSGLSTAGSTTSLTDASNERTPTANSTDVISTFLWMDGGTGVGQQAEITAYGTIGVMGWTQTLTSPAADTTWVRCSIRPQLIIDAIASVTRTAWRKQALPYKSTALITNNLLQWPGSFEEWSNGTSSAPDGWTLSGAGASVARDTVEAFGSYAAALTAGGGAVGVLTCDIATQFGQGVLARCAGQTVILLGSLLESTAGDAVVRVTSTDSTGATTDTNRTGTIASSTLMQDLEDISTAGIALPDPLTALSVQCRAVASATCNFDDLVLYGPPLYVYTLPSVLIGLEPVIWMETAYRSNIFTIPLYYGADWKISGTDATSATSIRDIEFKRALPSARHLLINGYRAPDVQTTQSSNVEPNPEWLALAAAVYVLEQSNLDAQGERRLRNLKEQLNALERTTVGNVLLGKGFVPIESR